MNTQRREQPGILPPPCTLCGTPTTWTSVWIDNGGVYCPACALVVRIKRFGENEEVQGGQSVPHVGRRCVPQGTL